MARELARAVGLGVLPLTLLGCQKMLPTAPSDLSAGGIAIYEHANFQGGSAYVQEDVSNLDGIKGPCLEVDGTFGPGGGSSTTRATFDDCLSSVRVAPGWAAVLYRDDGYGDAALEVTVDVDDLSKVAGPCAKGGFNDCISSIRVFRR